MSVMTRNEYHEQLFSVQLDDHARSNLTRAIAADIRSENSQTNTDELAARAAVRDFAERTGVYLAVTYRDSYTYQFVLNDFEGYCALTNLSKRLADVGVNNRLLLKIGTIYGSESTPWIASLQVVRRQYGGERSLYSVIAETFQDEVDKSFTLESDQDRSPLLDIIAINGSRLTADLELEELGPLNKKFKWLAPRFRTDRGDATCEIKYLSVREISKDTVLESANLVYRTARITRRSKISDLAKASLCLWWHKGAPMMAIIISPGDALRARPQTYVSYNIFKSAMTFLAQQLLQYINTMVVTDKLPTHIPQEIADQREVGYCKGWIDRFGLEDVNLGEVLFCDNKGYKLYKVYVMTAGVWTHYDSEEGASVFLTPEMVTNLGLTINPELETMSHRSAGILVN